MDFLMSEATGAGATACRSPAPRPTWDRHFHPGTLGADKNYDTRDCVAGMRARPEVSLVSEANSVDSTIALLPEARPDVILCGVSLPLVDPVELDERIRQNGSAVPIIVARSRLEEGTFDMVLRHHLVGYLTTNGGVDTLVHALQCTRDGLMVFGAESHRRLADMAGQPKKVLAPFGIDKLSSREQEILQLMVRGCANKEIADELSIGIRTVELHVSRVLKNLGVKTRVTAVVLALGPASTNVNR